MTSNYGLLQGLDVDLRPMFKEQANQSLSEQVAAQKQRDAADKRMEQLMGLIKIDPNATPHEYYQQNNQKIAADWMKGAQDAYAQDKTMINTPSATSSALKAQSEIILNNTASHALLNDQTLSTKGDYQLDPELSQIVASGGDIGAWVKQKTNGATDKYQPGMGLIKVFDENKLRVESLKGVPTEPRTIVVDLGHGHQARQTVNAYNPDNLAINGTVTWQNTPELQAKYTLTDWLATLPTHDGKFAMANLSNPSSGGGNTYIFGGNKHWGTSTDDTGAIYLTPTDQAMGTFGRVVWKGQPYEYTGAVISPDRQTVTITTKERPATLKASKNSYDVTDSQGKVIMTVPLADIKESGLIDATTGKPVDATMKVGQVIVPAHNVAIPLKDVHGQMEVNTGIKNVYKETKKAKAATNDDDFSQYKRKK